PRIEQCTPSELDPLQAPGIDITEDHRAAHRNEREQALQVIGKRFKRRRGAAQLGRVRSESDLSLHREFLRYVDVRTTRSLSITAQDDHGHRWHDCPVNYSTDPPTPR